MACQRALLSVAAQTQPIRSAAEADALLPAEQAGVVAVDRTGRVAFTHPLLASAIYGSAPAVTRREVHRELADRVTDPEERARHLALGASGPDAQVAGALTAAAARAHHRGAPSTAAELLELALEATPPEEHALRHAYTVAAAESHFHAGDRVRTRELAGLVVAGAPPGELAGRALRLLGMVRYHEDSYFEAVELLERAATELRDHPLVVDLHVNLAHAKVSLNDFPGSMREADIAMTQACRFGDKALAASALAVSAMAELFVGRPPDWARLDAALAGEDPDRQVTIQLRPTWIAGAVRLYVDDFPPARSLLTGLRQRVIDRGEENDLPFLSFHLSMLERQAGDLTAALRYATEACDLAHELGSVNLRLLSLGERCYVRATLGDLPGAREDAERGLALAEGFAYPAGSAFAHAAAAFLALTVGDSAHAADLLEPVIAPVRRLDFCHPVATGFVADAVEALTAAGRPDQAAGLIGPLRRSGEVCGRPVVAALTLRCEAMVHAARGDLGAAVDAVGAAVAVPELAVVPIERGRTPLLHGQLLRRTRQKLRAREALLAALADFDTLPAPLWSRRAGAELGRVGPRSSRPDELTPTERRVAELAAGGLTNREIAERSFLSPKTVEANIARVYRKLGIRSRAELGARMRDRVQPAEA